MSVDGKWTLTVNSPMGAQKSDVTLKAEGSTLTGSATAQGNTSELTDGKIDGDNVSFKVSVTIPMAMTLEFTGTVSGDSMSGNCKAGAFGSFPFTGERA